MIECTRANLVAWPVPVPILVPVPVPVPLCVRLFLPWSYFCMVGVRACGCAQNFARACVRARACVAMLVIVCNQLQLRFLCLSTGARTDPCHPSSQKARGCASRPW